MPATISEIDFKTPSRKRKLENEGQTSCVRIPNRDFTSTIDRGSILDKLYSVYPDSALFTVVPGYLPPPPVITPTISLPPTVSHDESQSMSMSPCLGSSDLDLPPLLSSLFTQENVGCTAESIKRLCHDTFDNMAVTTVQANSLSSLTVEQSKSTLWFDHRLGWITASHMHNVLKYTGRKYPKSIVSAIMQYTSLNSELPALQWGREHEAIAREEYVVKMNGMHDNFHTSLSGLVINPTYPYMAASPDGISSCDCCGTRLLEIKCPYVYRNESPTIEAALSNPRFCLTRNENDTVMLSRKHSYNNTLKYRVNSL